MESQRRQDDIRRLLTERLALRNGARGVARARAVLAAADGFAESAGESRVRWIALSRGLPRPILQLEVVTDLGCFYPDIAWRLADLRGDPHDRRVIAEEYDGVDKYGSGDSSDPAAVLYRESRRDQALADRQVWVRHRGKREVGQPAALFADLVQRFPPGVLLRPLRPVPGLYLPRRATHEVARYPRTRALSTNSRGIARDFVDNA